MRNLEQIRAAHAIAFWHPSRGEGPSAKGANQGDVISKLPTLIQSNGLLATAAFARSKGGGHEVLLLEVFRHLSSNDVRVLGQPPAPQGGETELDRYIRLVSGSDSERLRAATDEALAYLGYLKRFAP